MKYYYIVLYRLFGKIPRNGKLNDYIKKQYEKLQEDRDKKIFFIQFKETNNYRHK